MLEDVEKLFRKGSKAYRFCEIADIDEDGFSRAVTLEEYTKIGLKTTNGGDWCRSDGTLGKIFNIRRNKNKGKIISVQLIGYKKNTFERKIIKEMRDIYKNDKCAILGVGSGFIEVDHKDGRNDKYGELSKDVNDYQPLHKCANDAKRSHCLHCVESNIRFDARLLGYSISQWKGDEKYNGSCIGCYWYDPKEFNKKISENFKKDR